MNLKSKPTFILLAMLMVAGFAYSQNPTIPQPDLTEDISKSITLFLEEIPSELLTNYGIKNKDEIKKATHGNPIAVFTIDENGLKFTNTWRLPLIIDNEQIALFTLHKSSDDKYKIVDFGATLLAEEFSKFGKENDFSAILRVYKLRKDFFMYKDSRNEWNFQPIPVKEKRQYSLNEIIALMK